jgi:hypothetical protein
LLPIFMLFTRQQIFLQKKKFSKFYLSKNFFLKGSKHKNGKNRYKSIQIYTIFWKIHVSTPPKIFFCWKKKFFLRSCENKTSTCEHPFTNLAGQIINIKRAVQKIIWLPKTMNLAARIWGSQRKFSLRPWRKKYFF